MRYLRHPSMSLLIILLSVSIWQWQSVFDEAKSHNLPPADVARFALLAPSLLLFPIFALEHIWLLVQFRRIRAAHYWGEALAISILSAWFWFLSQPIR